MLHSCTDVSILKLFPVVQVSICKALLVEILGPNCCMLPGSRRTPRDASPCSIEGLVEIGWARGFEAVAIHGTSRDAKL